MIRTWIDKMLTEFWALMSGGIMAILSYFTPIKDIVNLMLLLFIVDVIFGFWANRKTRGERFTASKIWETTIPRMTISLILVIAAFLWDYVYGTNGFCTHRVIGGFISGVLLVSIAQNGYKITDWSLFVTIAQIVESQFKNITKKSKKK